jgi:hypothetical protein
VGVVAPVGLFLMGVSRPFVELSMVGVDSCSWVRRSLDGGCRDFALNERVLRRNPASSLPLASLLRVLTRVDKSALVLSTLGLRVEKLGRRFDIVSLEVSSVNTPGPIDFLGGRVGSDVDDDGGIWLWRRALDEGAGGGGIMVFVVGACPVRRFVSLCCRMELDLVVLVAPSGLDHVLAVRGVGVLLV